MNSTDLTQVRALVLVEGDSDRAAVEALAGRRGRSLDADGVAVRAMGGATNIGHFVRRYGADLRLAGLYDAAEERFFARALGPDLAARGFFRCDADLEDELIRALGPAAVERIVAAEGELRSLRTFQHQPAQLGRTVEQQLHRFLGTRSGRKIRYGRLLVDVLDLDRTPPALDRLLAAV